MQDGIAEIEEWLSSQAPGFRSGLRTVVELVRLLMEATGQLHTALERASHDETRSRQRKELDDMKWNVERRRLVQETEALREGLTRQREHLAYLESELAKARGHGHGQTYEAHHPTITSTNVVATPDHSRTKAYSTDGHASNNVNNNINNNNSNGTSEFGVTSRSGHGQDTPMHARTPPRTPTKAKTPEPTLNRLASQQFQSLNGRQPM
jgi:hypothetical protein